jgi:hypothetical protein
MGNSETDPFREVRTPTEDEWRTAREGLVRDGILEWRGATRNGKKVWQLTEKAHHQKLWDEVRRKSFAEGGSRDTMIDRALLYFLQAGGKIENIPE